MGFDFLFLVEGCAQPRLMSTRPSEASHFPSVGGSRAPYSFPMPLRLRLSSLCGTRKRCFLLESYLLQEVLPDVSTELQPLQHHSGSVLESSCGACPVCPSAQSSAEECLSPCGPRMLGLG